MISSSAAALVMAVISQLPPGSGPQQTPPTASRPAATAQAPAKTPDTTTTPEPNPLTHIFQNLGHDLKALPSEANLYALLAGGGAALAAHRYDDNVQAWVLEQTPSGESALGNFIGNGGTQTGIAIGVWAAGRWVKDDELVHVGSDLIRAQMLDGVLTQVPKYVFNRTRPSGGRYSFPSGHTSSIFATATVLEKHYGPIFGAPAYLLGSFVAWSRVRSQQHWLSDVMMGGAIGVISGLTVTRGHHQTWSLTPVKTPGGAALYFTIAR